MYGANNRRTQAPPDIKLRRPSRSSGRAGSARSSSSPPSSRRRRVRRQLQGPHLCAEDEQRQGDLAALGRAAGRWRPRRDRRRRSRRARDGRNRARARPAQRQAALALPRRLADRVLADRLRRARLLRRLERPRLRARPEAAEAPLELPHRRQDHLERRDRGEDAYIGDYGGRCIALSTRTGKRRFVRSSTVASTARPRSPRGGSSSPRRPATA